MSSKNAFKVADDLTVGFGVDEIKTEKTGEGDKEKTSLKVSIS